jgi:hypothetical protein
MLQIEETCDGAVIDRDSLVEGRRESKTGGSRTAKKNVAEKIPGFVSCSIQIH